MSLFGVYIEFFTFLDLFKNCLSRSENNFFYLFRDHKYTFQVFSFLILSFDLLIFFRFNYSLNDFTSFLCLYLLSWTCWNLKALVFISFSSFYYSSFCSLSLLYFLKPVYYLSVWYNLLASYLHIYKLFF